MALKSIRQGWRAFSATAEAAYGTAESTIDELLHFEGQPASVKAAGIHTNEEEINGLVGVTERDVLTKALEFTHEQRAMPMNIALFGALCLGKVTTDQPDAGGEPNAYRHYLERDLTTLEMKSVTMIENDGVQQKEYPGVVCKTLAIIGERGGFVKINAGLMGDGAESNDATSKPTQEAESYLRFGDVTIKRGGTMSGSVAGGNLSAGSGTDISAKVREFNFLIDNQGEAEYHFGNSDKAVDAMRYGKRWLYELSMTVEMEDTTYHDAMLASTEYVIDIPIVGGVIAGGAGAENYKAIIYLPKVQFDVEKISDDKGIVLANLTATILEDATYGDCIIEIRNAKSAYLN